MNDFFKYFFNLPMCEIASDEFFFWIKFYYTPSNLYSLSIKPTYIYINACEYIYYVYTVHIFIYIWIDADF